MIYQHLVIHLIVKWCRIIILIIITIIIITITINTRISIITLLTAITVTSSSSRITVIIITRLLVTTMSSCPCHCQMWWLRVSTWTRRVKHSPPCCLAMVSINQTTCQTILCLTIIFSAWVTFDSPMSPTLVASWLTPSTTVTQTHLVCDIKLYTWWHLECIVNHHWFIVTLAFSGCCMCFILFSLTHLISSSLAAFVFIMLNRNNNSQSKRANIISISLMCCAPFNSTSLFNATASLLCLIYLSCFFSLLDCTFISSSCPSAS